MTGIMLYGSSFAAGLAANHFGRKVLALRDIHRAAVVEERHTNVVRLLTPYKTEHHIDLVAEAEVETDTLLASTLDEPLRSDTPVRLHSVSG